MKRKTLLAVVSIFALVTLACSLTGGAGEEVPEATQPPAESGGETPAPLPAATAPPEQESPRIRPTDGMEMIHIPAGEFLMGDDASAFAPEKPAHIVYLDEYWIDRTEVTNAQYRACVEAETCPEPKLWSNEDLNGDDQPVLVPWESARAYCEWVVCPLPGPQPHWAGKRGAESTSSINSERWRRPGKVSLRRAVCSGPQLGVRHPLRGYHAAAAVAWKRVARLKEDT